MPVRSAGLAALLLLAAAAGAQTFPAPYDLGAGDYVFTAWPETSPAGTYPPSMRFHRGPAQDPALAAEPNADYTDAYGLTAGSRINGMGAEGFSFLNTGTLGTLGAAVLALNTTGQQNVRVTWTGGTVAAGTRPYRIRLQYRVGAAGAFTDVPGPVEYVADAAGHSQEFAATLPAETSNQPVVHVRWKYYQADTGTGARPRLRVDDVAVSTSDAPGSGTGTAAFDPAVIRGGQTQAVTLVVTARSDDPADRLTHIDLTLPDAWPTVAPGDVLLTPGGGTVTVEGRTIRVAGASASQSAPLRIAVTGVAVPDASGAFGFGVRTGAGSAQTVALPAQPALYVWGTPLPIAEASANDAQGVSVRLGQWVTVRGVVTVSDQFQTGSGEFGPSYLQDASGGMAVFSPAGVTAQVALGDEVILLGRVDQFFGLNQLDNATFVVEHLGAGAPVEPLVVTLAQLAADGQGGVEVYEGRLVRVNGVTVNTTVWNAEGAGMNYLLTDATGTLAVRVNRGVDFAGTPAPAGAFDLVGVMSQFRPAPPNIGGYQLLPRFAADILDDSDAPVVTSAAPFESAATPSSVTLSWTTDRPAHSEVRYVRSDTGEGGVLVVPGPTTAHAVTLTGLDPATVYTVELRSAAGTDTVRIAGYPVVTRAPPGTTHAIRPVFNRSVDHALSTGTPAEVAAFAPLLIERIDAAQHAVDVALYSLSGTAGANIAAALIAAHQRGVRVRVIMDDATSNTAPPTSLRNAGVPFITDAFGGNDGAAGLHHHKFAVFDYPAGAPAAVWVMTGSWNPTDPGSTEHHQNVVWVQDGALAAAYAEEFVQMWGSRTATPDPARSRFGANKALASPTVVWLGDTRARVFFSPQGFGAYGSTERQILDALATADHEILLALNLITRQPLVDAMRARFDAGVAVRGAVGEITTTGSVFPQLAAWADVHAFPSGTLGLLHHKYALIDPLHPASDPVTITGSHNWSRSANEANDENTLFLHDAAVANQYLQEFVVRYREAGGAHPVGVAAAGGEAPGRFAVTANAPNPFGATTTFTYDLPAAAEVRVRLYNVLGQEVRRVLDAAQPAGTYRVTLDAAGLAAGVYVYVVEAAAGPERFREARRMVVAR